MQTKCIYISKIHLNQILINIREKVGIKYDESILNMKINHKELMMSKKV